MYKCLKENVKFKIIFLCQIVLLAMVAMIILAADMSKTILSPNISFWQSRYVEYTDDGWVGLQEDLPEEGDFIYGPFVNLNKGFYTVSVEYSTDSDQEYSSYSYNNVDAIFTFDDETLESDHCMSSSHFWVKDDIEDFEVRIHYNGSGNISIKNIIISRSTFVFKLILIAVMFGFAVGDAIYLDSKIQFRAVFTDSDRNFLKYRSTWMAVAILWIMFFHSGISTRNAVMNFLHEYGYGGVDIFFFASGIGCYFSYVKEHDTAEFIKRRFFKIMPTYYLFIVPWLIYQVMIEGMHYQSVVGNLLCVEGFRSMSSSFNWYMTGIWMLYMLTPLLAAVVEKKIFNKKRLMCAIVVLVLASTFSWDNYDWVIIFTRIPIYLIGMYVAGRMARKEFRMSIVTFIYLEIIMALGVAMLILSSKHLPNAMWDKGLHWYPFILIVPGVCALLSWVFYNIEKVDVLHGILNIFNYLGNITFEIYLVHIVVFRLVSRAIGQGNLYRSTTIWILAGLISIAGASLMHVIVDNLKRIAR